MKTIKNLDVQDIQQQIDSTKQFISQTKSGVEQVKQAIGGITSLHDGLEGKTADSIRSFFTEAHQPFLEFMESFLVQYEEALSSVMEKVSSFESNEKGFIRQEYLEGELSNTMEKARDSVSSTTDAINQQLNSVSDIAAVADISDQVFLDAISEAKKSLHRTVDNMYEMDASAASKLDKPEEDIQQMKAYLAGLRDAIDRNNISVEHFAPSQFKGDFFSEHQAFKLLAKGRNTLNTGEKAAITDENFNELYPLIKNTEYVSDGEYEWHGTYYTLTDGRIVREYKHDTGVSYEFVDKVPDPRKAPPSGFDKVAKWGWDFLTEDIVTIFDPDASAGEKAFAIAMFLPVGKPVKAIDKFGGGFISDGVKSLEKIIDNQSSVKKATKDGKSSVSKGIEQKGNDISVDPLNKGTTFNNPYSGVKQASDYLQSQGVPRPFRKTTLESFDINTIKLDVADSKTYGLRFYDDINASAKGRYLFETFSPQVNRRNLALPPEWNKMTGVKQWKIKPGTTIIKGKAGPQLQMGNQYTGGIEQWYITNLDDLIKP